MMIFCYFYCKIVGMESSNTMIIVYQVIQVALGAFFFWFLFLKFGSLIITFLKWVYKGLTRTDRISQLEKRIQELEKR